jgi:hypothetical protein
MIFRKKLIDKVKEQQKEKKQKYEWWIVFNGSKGF